MTQHRCISAKATPAACDDYTDLTQVPSTNTVHSDQTVIPTTPVTMEDRSNTNNMHSQASPEEKKSSRSRASSSSSRRAHDHTRSTSSSTAGGRRPVYSRRTTAQSIQPSLRSRGSTGASMSPQRREQLIALHRESCRLFQDASANIPVVDALIRSETRSTTTKSSLISPTASPTLHSQRSHSFPQGYYYDNENDISDEDLLSSASTRNLKHRIINKAADGPEISTTQQQQQQIIIPPTITEWTSPSTRRREYEKIDRNNRGFRRIWRRWTPSCMHAADGRVPFFEEAGNGKRNYEGSVRRFRMDIPDDEEDDGVVGQQNEKGVQVSTTSMTAGPKVEKGRWSCF